MTVDEISDLYYRISTVTTRFVFTDPVADEDLAHVRAALEQAVPGFRVTVARDPDPRYIAVDVSDATRSRYGRQMIVGHAHGALPQL